MDEPLPFTALLSFALVAFIIETDNAAESQIPHSTTRFGKSTAVYGLWLTSIVMWQNCLKHLPDEGITAGELEQRARTGTNWNGMLRWGYVWMAPSPMDTRAKPPMADWLVKPTAAGTAAKQVWERLPPAIERRWEKRFGWDEIEALRTALRDVVVELPPTLPDCMPILGFGLWTRQSEDQRSNATVAAPKEPIQELKLLELLSRALVAFALEFEYVSELSLALCADVLRVMNVKGVRTRDLPMLSGVSREAIAMALGFMEKQGLCLEEQEGTGKARVVKLTPKGRAAQLAYRRLETEIETRWALRFGDRLARLRKALEKLLGDSGWDQTELLNGIAPQKGCWRAELSKPKTLPWFPMVLHRGGYPDGS